MDDYDYLHEDDFDDRDIMCGICEEEGLHWADHGKGFRLYDEDNKLHVCHPPSADDFESIT